jgi:hypothetical protein
MAKLHQVFKVPVSIQNQLEERNGKYDCHTGFEDEGPNASVCDGKDGRAKGNGAADVPTPAKFIRLGFHDCIGYTDGTGGCDGCFRFYDQFMRYNDLASGDKTNMRRDDPVKGTNNGLAMTADVLELIFTVRKFPSDAPQLPQSLKKLGKSRADLWAFAALVATDYAMAENNRGCRGDGGCGHLYNEINPPFKCEIEPSRNLRFYTGRRDCPASSKPVPNEAGYVKTERFQLPEGHKYRDYETTKDEEHPNPSGNSSMITDYMKRVFNFNKKETVAIMGAHSLGKMHGEVSLFKYQWQWQQIKFLNNNFYRMLANKPSKFIGTNPCKHWRAAGGPNGENAKVTWVVRPVKKSISAGPYIWFHRYTRCPDCYRDDAGNWVNADQRGSKAFKSVDCCVCHTLPENEVPKECVQDVTRDEVMIPTDISMMYSFDVDEYGVPTGCPNFPDQWNRKNLIEQASGIKGHKLDFHHTEPKCKKNGLRDEKGGKTMAQWVVHYADNQNDWANDFYDAWEKMLSNGSPDLELGPDVLGIERATCTGTDRKTIKCQV